MRTAIVVAGGPKKEIVLDDFLFPHNETVYIGADHGSIYLLEAGIIPNAAVGDFDSLTLEEWQLVKEQVAEVDGFQAEKNETDTELAIIKALTYEPEIIYITGVTGGRLDHYESNLHSVYRLQQQNPSIPLIIVNTSNCLQFLFAGMHTIRHTNKYKYLSFYPFGGPIAGVTLTGVKYTTNNLAMPIGSGRFTSNEIVEAEATLQFTDNAILMIRSRD
ncbi:thiamine diphosphokinase [Kurthia sibirica]|uniref:Thiamine diphosphokinase n=1 Tax=Kurthia sibirica TaxID=202750 RepID=A0A2U3AQT0_9BACL|nr:thiamine diphosphokinase [Kurthia sibirica]PWI26856.1 thiamine diphosphokinase [Kurthia sibirica]GEK32606.1 thiamine pyrophosphokinase [Kurthia sibirica]